MNRIATPLFAAGLVAVGLMAASGGVAEIQGKDRTGAPGSDQVCSQCHSGGGAATASIEILDPSTNEAVTSYMPGNEYIIRMLVESSDAIEFGAQGTAIDANGDNAGTFTNPSGNTQLEDVGGRHIVEHNSASATNAFEATWTAPATGMGTVSFYMSGVAANGNSTSQGDRYAGASLDLTEATSDVALAPEWEVAQPIRTATQWTWQAPQAGRLVVSDLAGRTVEAIRTQEFQTVRWNAQGIQVVHFVAEDGRHLTWKLAGL